MFFSIASDLFFLYREANGSFTSSGHVTWQRLYYKYFYPPTITELCSTIYLDVRVNVPCHPLDVILAEYGPNWTAPIEDYDYKNAPRNQGPAITYPPGFKAYRAYS